MTNFVNEEEMKANQERIENLYQNIQNCMDLVEWLEYRLDNNEYSLAIADADLSYIAGKLDGIYFRVEMPKATRVILKVEDWGEEYDYIIEALRKAIAPCIWNLGSGVNRELNGYRGEAVRYEFNSVDDEPVKAIGWDVEDPEAFVQEMFIKTLTGQIKLERVEPCYPDADSKKLLLNSRFGEYTGFADKEYINQIKNYSEFELFVTIKSMSEEIAKYYNAVISQKRDRHEFDPISQNYSYALSFLMQQTTRFGVKVNPPANEPTDTTVEFEAWYFWWEEAFDKLLRENPDVLEEWKKFENGFDPNFKPDCSYQEYFEAYKELYEYENKKQVVDTIKCVADTKKVMEERKQTPQGRALNLATDIVQRVRKDTHEINNNEKSAFDYLY